MNKTFVEKFNPNMANMNENRLQPQGICDIV